uniref:RNA-directed DNA polymerase n=1 Tax=Plectus sambesii TaxID=2011161 RepID=A0A914W055_9BILA
MKVALSINGHPVRLKYDTGAAVTIVNATTWASMGKPNLKPSLIRCHDFNSNKIIVKEQTSVQVYYNNKSVTLPLLVAAKGDDIMGQPWIRALQLCHCSFNKALSTTSYVFSVSPSPQAMGAGDKRSTKALLHDFPLIFEPGLGHSRPLPFAVYDAVDKEIDWWEQQGIIQPVNHSEWAAPIVIAPKPGGQIRIYVDFSTGLNKAIDIHQYPLPKPKELYQKLNGGIIFSKIDFSEAYLQVELDDESKRLVVINMHKGLYRFNRLPFGVSLALAIFQQTMEKMLAGIPGVGAYLDDVIVYGGNQLEHNHRLRQVLKRISKFGFQLKKEKCCWAKPSIEYLGFIYNAKGVHSNPKKMQAISQMPPPKNVSQLRSFLGMVNHYSKFMPHLSLRLSPLHQLLKKGEDDKFVKFEWTSACQSAFKGVKNDLVSPLMLTHYDPQLPIILAADASSTGIGAIIAQQTPNGDLPIAHASKTLTEAESRYPQIEKEALALLFGVKKFHQYLWGRHFTLQTDHQPLVKIFGSKKGLPTMAANCLQNYAITLMAYSFDIEYVNTKKFGQADGLSRLLVGTDVDFNKSRKDQDNSLLQLFTKTLTKSPVHAAIIAKATANDTTLKKVMRLHRKGWPNKLSSGFDHAALMPYFRICYQLSIMNNSLLWGLRLIIPESLQPQVLKQLHKTHPGQVAMKRIARKHFWWPNFDIDVENIVSRCERCNKAQHDPPKVPLRPWPMAERPWQRAHIDFAGLFMDRMWLIIVDTYSKWPEVIQMKRGKTDTERVTIKLLKLFSRFGIIEELVLDK